MSNLKLPSIKSLGTRDVFVAGVALVVASSTFVSEFTGYFTLGSAFIVSLLLGFLINLLLALSAADLSMAFPRAGALYDYAKSIFPGRWGKDTGMFLGLTFIGMFAFAASGETASGAYGLKALTGLDLPVEAYIIVCTILALIPNLFGIKSAAWASAGLLLAMLAVRWFFGLAGFMGWGQTEAWAMTNLDPGASVGWFTTNGIVTSGLALAIWSFVGIEFACSLAEDVAKPKKSMPRGLVLGLFAILATSLVMGLGVAGSMPLSDWQLAASSEIAAGGEAPQLAVGQVMFGVVGYKIMALGSFAATLGTLTVAYAAMPRLLMRLGQDNCLPAPVSTAVAKVNPKTGAPVCATLLLAGVYLIPALFSAAVVDWLYSAAYVWVLLYLVFHVLALIHKLSKRSANEGLPRALAIPVSCLGIVATSAGLYYAFAGGHTAYGGRALIVLLIAATISVISGNLRSRQAKSAAPAESGTLIPVTEEVRS